MFEENNLSESAIKSELDHILSGRNFIKSPLLTRFLRFVVERSLDGHANQIKEYTVGIEVFDKPHNFSPQTDASVRIAAIRLRKLLEEHYHEYHSADTIRIHLPKGSYAPIFTKDLADYRFDVQVKNQGTQNIPLDSICVVPFSGLVHTSSNDFSLEGFSAYLSEKLSLFQETAVKSFTSVSAFLRGGGSIDELGSSLKVTYYLSGNIEIEDLKTKVSVHLFDAGSNTLIWSHDFSAEGKSDSLSVIIEEIVSKIVSSIAGYSGLIHYKMFSKQGGEVPPINDTHAMAVFWFYNCQARLSESTYRDALYYLEKSIQDDPNCDLCWAVLAHLYLFSLVYNFDAGVDYPIGKAQTYLERAFALNPNGQQAHLTLGWIGLLTHDKSIAISAFEKADQLNPNSSYAKAVCGMGLSFLGEYERADEMLEGAARLNPLPYWWFNLPAIFKALKTGDFDMMLYYSRKIGTPAGTYEHLFEMIALYYLGDSASLKKMLLGYLEKYPKGLEHAVKFWKQVLFDAELAEKIISALQAFRNHE